MIAVVRLFIAVLIVALAGAGFGLWYVRSTGLTTRAEPSAFEVAGARFARRFAVPSDARNRPNRVTRSEAAIASGRAHFADHCASCHANDGSGNTGMGRGLFPRSPDMRQPPTQDLTDGELFWIIENGVRFTGMPAWGTGTPEGEQASWELVHFIRRLPQLTAQEIEEMEQMNPRPPAEIRRDIEAERFLQGLP